MMLISKLSSRQKYTTLEKCFYLQWWNVLSTMTLFYKPNVGLTIVCQNYRNITIRNKEKCNNSERF